MPTTAVLTFLASATLGCLAALPQEEGLAQVEALLERRPEDPALLQQASRLAEAEGDRDKALWYAQLAGSAERAAALDPVRGAQADLWARWESLPVRVLETARSCARQGLYRNAADLYLRCRGTPVEAEALQELDAMVEREAAAHAVRDQGFDWRTDPAREPGSVHAPWDEAWERRTDHYLVRTNLGDVLLRDLCRALEHMHRHYRDLFQVHGRTPRCTVRVYANRAEFEAHEGVRAQDVQGFYVPDEHLLATFDPRAEGRSRQALWSTLFHEAAHQFLAGSGKGSLPVWLNEGTACTFEGATWLPGGAVRFHGVPEGRLRWLERILERGRPALTEVLSYDVPGAYTADCYPIGWGLVYFLQNYEDESCQPVYLPHYRAYLRSYRRHTRHDVVGRFVEYFVERPDQEGVETLEQLLQRFRDWIHERHADHYGPPERADRWRERARRQQHAGQEQAALESLQFALQRRPGHAATRWELAQLQLHRKQPDTALLTLRHLWESLQGRRAEAAVEGLDLTVGQLEAKVRASLVVLHPPLEGLLKSASTEDVPALKDLATRYYQQGLPRSALLLLDQAQELLGGSAVLADLRRIVAAARQVDGGRWRRLLPEAGGTVPGWSGDGAVVQRDREPLAPWVLRERMPDHYRLSVHLEGNASITAGLLFAGQGNTQRRVGCHGGSLLLFTVFEEELVGVRHLADLPVPQDSWHLEVEVQEQECRFFLDGRPVGNEALPAFAWQGEVGVYAAPGARLRNPKARY